MLRRSFVYSVSVVAMLAAFTSSEHVEAVGYWNLPGTVCQCTGYGNGAGYHAKFVLGPITAHDTFAHNEVRLPYAPQPPYPCYCQYGCGCGFGQQSVLPPNAMPAASPIPAYEEPVPMEVEPSAAPALEPEPVDMEPESSSGADTSAPPPPPVLRSGTPARALFDPPVER